MTGSTAGPSSRPPWERRSWPSCRRSPAGGSERRRSSSRRSASGSPAAEAYRSLRTNLQFISRDGSVRVISVTSPHAGEGKTTTVANLATTLALTGKRVMALSADLRKPRLHRFFGLDNEKGLSSVLAGQAQLADVARRVEGLDSLRIVTSGPVPPNPAELLSSDEMELLLRHLRSTADYVVIDTPPALVVTDAMIVAPRVDGVVVVVDSDVTTGRSRRAPQLTRWSPSSPSYVRWPTTSSSTLRRCWSSATR